MLLDQHQTIFDKVGRNVPLTMQISLYTRSSMIVNVQKFDSYSFDDDAIKRGISK